MKENYYLQIVLNAIDFIEDQIFEPINVDDVCSTAQMSSWQFQRVFRATTGDSIGNYIRGRRLTLAAKLLQENSHLGVLDIALQSQFSSQESFTRSFKKMFNITPAKVKTQTNFRMTELKPKLSREKLAYFQRNMQKEPKVTEMSAKTFIGLPMNVYSPIGVDIEYNANFLKHWKNFNIMRKKIPNSIKGFSYGLITSQSQELNEESLIYTASSEVHNSDFVPNEMNVLKLNQATYAVFEVKNNERRCHFALDYIYGIWLPQSPYKRARGTDFEIFDHQKYQINNPLSLSHYCIPIILK